MYFRYLFESLVERSRVMAPFENVHDLLFCGEVEVAGDGVFEGCGSQRVVQLLLLVVGEEADGVQPAAHEGIAHTDGIDDIWDIDDG